jgi:hypothetical protein
LPHRFLRDNSWRLVGYGGSRRLKHQSLDERDGTSSNSANDSQNEKLSKKIQWPAHPNESFAGFSICQVTHTEAHRVN